MNDLISRQAASYALNTIKVSKNETWYSLYQKVLDVFSKLPSAEQKSCEYWDAESNYCALNRPSTEPERKKGRWVIYVISPFDGEGCKCSECGFEGAPYWDYCPNCGAKMEVDDDCN